MERDHGRIVSVSTRTLGSVLDGDHAAGATSLVLFDAGDFDETGGTLSINGATLAYASADDDAATITLTDPLPAAALDGDFVACWDTLYDAPVTVKTAMVQVDGDDDNPDPIECFVPHYLADKLADGDRGGPGESVTIGYDEDEDEWQILDVRGLAGASGAGEKFEADDHYTLTASDINAGTVTFPLSHTPIQDSLTAWCGIPQPPTEFTIDYNAPSITFPLAGFEEAGDEIWVHYAYRNGPVKQALSGPVDFSSAYNDGSTGTITFALPEGTRAGDTLLLVTIAGYHPVSTPDGWTPLLSDNNDGGVNISGGVYTKTATADDAGSNVTITFSGAEAGASIEVGAATIRGVSSVTTSVDAILRSSGAVSITTPSFTPNAGDLIMMFGGSRHGGLISGNTFSEGTVDLERNQDLYGSLLIGHSTAAGGAQTVTMTENTNHESNKYIAAVALA